MFKFTLTYLLILRIYCIISIYCAADVIQFLSSLLNCNRKKANNIIQKMNGKNI